MSNNPYVMPAPARRVGAFKAKPELLESLRQGAERIAHPVISAYEATARKHPGLEVGAGALLGGLGGYGLAHMISGGEASTGAKALSGLISATLLAGAVRGIQADTKAGEGAPEKIFDFEAPVDYTRGVSLDMDYALRRANAVQEAEAAQRAE